MTTVLMKFLETRPADYDRGIRFITLGRIREVKEQIAAFIQPGDRLLEIGCGTGTLAVRCAERGAEVVGIDASPAMLAQARQKVAAAGLEERIQLLLMDATAAGEHFEASSFDWVVSTLVFSEMGGEQQAYVLRECRRLLKPEGRLLIADEVEPEALWARLLVALVRLPLAALTWLVARTTTRSVRRFPQRLAEADFSSQGVASYLAGTLQLYLAWPAGALQARSAAEIPPLHHRVTLWTLLKDLYCLFWRNIPPYPQVRPALYRVGFPQRSSPVIVTGNYDLTVRRVVRALDGRVDLWLLVADSEGINVWCGAGGGHLTAEKVIAALKVNRVEEWVDHRRLVLPQLCANGVVGARITEETGWRVRWGPCYADDLPAYLERGMRKTDAMRWVRFPLLSRLEMAVVMWQFWAVLLAVILAIVRRSVLLPAMVLSLALFLVEALIWPYWPRRNGLWHGVGLALISLALLTGWSVAVSPLSGKEFFNWAVGLTALALFVGADYQGGTPSMRGGEIEHLGKLLPIGLLLLAAYLWLPGWLGW